MPSSFTTRFFSFTLVALLILHGHLVKGRLDMQARDVDAAGRMQARGDDGGYGNGGDNKAYGGDNKVQGYGDDNKAQGYGDDNKAKGYGYGGDNKDQGYGYGGDNKGSYGDKGGYGNSQVLWGQCTFLPLLLALCDLTDFFPSLAGGGKDYHGTTKCPDASYCRYFSDCTSFPSTFLSSFYSALTSHLPFV